MLLEKLRSTIKMEMSTEVVCNVYFYVIQDSYHPVTLMLLDLWGLQI